ncbi:MAG: hypothetical protein OXC08_03170, partial [Thiotrichales bacterium]|nr:hypothetical protein [Thiotrichales bacterium]
MPTRAEPASRLRPDAVESARSERMEAASGDAGRLRPVLDGSRTIEVGSETAFTPSAEVGVRDNGGAANPGRAVVLRTVSPPSREGIAERFDVL